MKERESEDDGYQMSPEAAQKLYNEGGFLVVTQLPPGSEFGIDLYSWNTGEKFLGVKMIPPGLHFVYYSTAGQGSSGPQLAPRTGFFHTFHQGEVVVKRYDKSSEELVDVGEDEVARVRQGLKDMDSRLGPYPLKQWKKWVSLSNRVKEESLSRLQPKTGTVCAVTQVASGERSDIENAETDPEARINYSSISRDRHPAGCSAKEITEHAMDSSYRLELLLSEHTPVEEVLVELQFSFLCFLVGQNYDSFEHWKHLVALLCTCVKAMTKYPNLFISFMADLHFQMQEVPEDFFVDIISQNNFLVASLSDLFANVREHEDMSPQLRQKAISFENHLTKKFGWDFSQEEDEYAPVVVEL